MVQKGCFGFRQNVKSLRKKNTPPLHGKGRKLKKIRGNSHKKSNRRGARVGNEGQAALAAAARVLRLLLAERDMRGVVDVGDGAHLHAALVEVPRTLACAKVAAGLLL